MKRYLDQVFTSISAAIGMLVCGLYLGDRVLNGSIVLQGTLTLVGGIIGLLLSDVLTSLAAKRKSRPLRFRIILSTIAGLPYGVLIVSNAGKLDGTLQVIAWIWMLALPSFTIYYLWSGIRVQRTLATFSISLGIILAAVTWIAMSPSVTHTILDPLHASRVLWGLALLSIFALSGLALLLAALILMVLLSFFPKKDLDHSQDLFGGRN